MVIQCSSCDTRFKLADDKIKAGGVKVRCSKCKEVFTVQPPEDETLAESTPDFAADETSDESSGSDWSDLNTDSDSSDDDEESGGVDWSDIGGDGGDDDTESSSSDEISFGNDDDDDSLASDSIAFDDDSSDDSVDFSAGDSDDEVASDSFGFDDAVGEGANDEFSFDDDAGSSSDSSDDAPDFDWDGSDDSSDADNFDFGESEESAGGDLDFSSVALEDKEESPAPQPEPSSLIIEDQDKPLSAKGPQRGKVQKRGRKQRKAKGKSPLRGLFLFILFILVLAAGHAGILYWKGYWKGDPAELANLDHNTVHVQVYKNLYSEITGGKIIKAPVGQIAVLGMNGRFVENRTAGTLFVIEGKVKNEFKGTRSAIAVRGVLFDQNGKPTMRKKIYCGNKLSENELQELSLEKIQERLDNQFGDSLSNLDVSADVVLPYTIVFGNLPDNLAEFNVEVAESAPGSKD